MAAAATSMAVLLGGATAAHAAATVNVTGDDGNPVAIAQGAPVSIRNQSPTVGLAFPSQDGRFSATVTGPDGIPVSSALTCFINDAFTRYVDWRGNGNYTITITNYAKADTACAKATSTETYVFAINSSVSLGAPPGPFLIRAPNGYASNTLSIPVALNPGAGTYEVQYAQGAVLAPDGSISGPSTPGYVNTTTGTIDLSFQKPGTYTVVARAKNGSYYSGWSAPVNVVAIVPFDLVGVTFPDSRGPKYSLKGTVRETSLRGTVSLAMARRGAHNRYGKYKSIGKVHISSKGTFTKRFTQHKTGTYRVRIHYAGSPLAPATTIYGRVTITRRLVYR
jgi:hypothetical protein